MTRYAHDIPVGRSHRYHKVEFRVVVDDEGQITIAMSDGDGRLRTRLTAGEATKLSAILQTAALVAER